MPRKPDPENVFAFDRNTSATVQLALGQTERTVWDQATPGFGLRLREGRAKTWVFRPPPSSGKYGIMSLGPAAQLSLTQARDAARNQMAKARLGEAAPREAKAKAKAKAATSNRFGEVIKVYLERMETRIKPAGFRDLKRHLEIHFADLHGSAVAEIRRGDIAGCLDKIAVTAPVYANRARTQLTTFFVWAIGQGMLDMNPVLGTNKVVNEKPRDRVLTDIELQKVWRATAEPTDFDRIVRLLIMTGQRRDEVAGMTWDEVDLDAELWTIPPERTKNGRRHEVQLSAPVLKILREIPRREATTLIFGRGFGPFSGFSKSKDRIDAKLNLTTPWRLHDLRRTCSTGMNGLGVAPHIVEAVLNHVSGARAGVAGTYNWAAYRKEKREALDRWSAFVLALGKPRLEIAASDPQALRA